MNIHCLASSSSGNCYVIQNKQTTLMVEAGLDFKTTKSRLASLNIKLNDIDAVVITHQHRDHANVKTVEELSIYAPIIANAETLDSLTIQRKWRIKEWKSITIKTFEITAFEVDHDVAAFGYMIEDKDSAEKVLFINDTAFLRYNLSKHTFTRIMIECNHILDIVDMDDVRARRQIRSHLSLSGVVKALKTLDLRKTNEIYLMHLSDTHSDEKRMTVEVEKTFGIPTYVCGKEGGFI